MCDTCRDLLNEALNLSVRSERIEEVARRDAALDASVDPEAWQADGTFDRYVERHNARWPDRQMATRSATMPLWFRDQYDKDLADWTRRARAHLTECNRKEGQSDG